MEYPNVIFFLKKQIEALKNLKRINSRVRDETVEEFESEIEKLEEVK